MSFPDPPSLSPATDRSEELAGLVYELLDAHWDTERLMREPPNEIRRRAHLSYLQSLQRLGRAVLAEQIETAEIAPGPQRSYPARW